MDREQLGKIAYEAYGEHRRWRAVGGLSMPRWDECLEDIRDAWGRAAQAAVDAYRAGNVTVAQDDFWVEADRG